MNPLQWKLAKEMYNQGVDKPTLNWSMRNLKSEEQQNKILNFLIRIRDKEISQSEFITKVEETIKV